MEQIGQSQSGSVMFRPVRQVASPGAKSAVSDSVLTTVVIILYKHIPGLYIVYINQPLFQPKPCGKMADRNTQIYTITHTRAQAFVYLQFL